MILYCFDFFWLVVTSWFACCFILVRKEQFTQHIRHGTDSELSSFSIIKVQVFYTCWQKCILKPMTEKKGSCCFSQKCMIICHFVFFFLEIVYCMFKSKDWLTGFWGVLLRRCTDLTTVCSPWCAGEVPDHHRGDRRCRGAGHHETPLWQLWPWDECYSLQGCCGEPAGPTAAAGGAPQCCWGGAATEPA